MRAYARCFVFVVRRSRGDLTLIVSDSEQTRLIAEAALGDNVGFQFRPNNNIDRDRWSNETTIALKDTSAAFPVNKPLALLKWRMQSRDATVVPLTLTCWPTATGDSCEVSIEYELSNTDLALSDVQIRVPLPNDAAPSVDQVSGTTSVERGADGSWLVWTVQFVDADAPTGELVFTVAGDDEDAFFPISVAFESNTPLVDVEVCEVLAAGTDVALPFSAESRLIVDKYTIQ